MQRRPDHSVKYRQSLDYGSTGTAPQATNVCQCSQLQVSVWGRKTWRSTWHLLFILQSLLRYCSVPASLTATATQTILPMREQLPPEGGVVTRLESSKSPNEDLWSFGTDFFSFFLLFCGHMSFWTGNALNKSWRTTWWYCVTTKNCSN